MGIYNVPWLRGPVNCRRYSRAPLPTIFKVLLITALFLVLTGCKEIVYRDLGEQEANQMLAILLQAGIDSRKVVSEKGTFNLEVEKDSLGQAIRILQQHGYPKEQFTSAGEVFKKEGLLSSPLEERVRFIFALSQTMSETLSKIDGVITARVNLVVPENNPFDKGSRPSSAAVFIKYDPSYDLEKIKPDIKLLIQKSIEGLEYDKITLVMLPARQEEVVQQPQPVNVTESEHTASGWWWYLVIGMLAIASFWIGRRSLGSAPASPVAGESRASAKERAVVKELIESKPIASTPKRPQPKSVAAAPGRPQPKPVASPSDRPQRPKPVVSTPGGSSQ